MDAQFVLSLATVVIPLVGGYLGHLYATSMKQRDQRERYIAMAVEILREPPAPENRHLRGWAAELLNHYSAVPLPPEARADLVTRVSLRQQAMEDFDAMLRGKDDRTRRAMQAAQTRINLEALNRRAAEGQGLSVAQAKRLLSWLGHDAGTPDDRLTPELFDAVERFQAERGLVPADGILGRDTVAALLAAGRG